ncbi:unnamed protein product [Didymodactylos carnosus]|uniref:Uncharacterized protein n=1 Tax=Didymodactylos carnosus TaxID=1234261 RepID=A0A814TZB6_9BILA|nr:unnamed protein product [Didymodactylos carnosus]CAF1166709.1 unnamed protein product [Didymodactylos carnosus]CAF3583361.1 unnamed protein product [Didymodactylos carnosus]CAF3930332.1 unnamed protein product [Didymodactylos carnosus]
MARDVVRVYINAYLILQDKILNRLANVSVDELMKNETQVALLASELNCHISDLTTLLSTTFIVSDAIRIQADSKLLEVVQQTSAQENEVNDIEKRVSQANSRLQGARSMLSGAQTTLRNRELDAARAEQAYRDAERRVENARRCRGRRRKKRGFWDWLVKPVCSVFNAGGIKNALNIRNQASRDLTNARSQVSYYQSVVYRYEQEGNLLNTQLTNTRYSLQNSKNALYNLQQQRSVIISVTEQLKQAIRHINELSTAATVLKDAVTDIIDFELLIKPMNAIYDELQRNQVGINLDNPTISADDLEETKTKLMQLIITWCRLKFKDKMYQYLLLVVLCLIEVTTSLDRCYSDSGQLLLTNCVFPPADPAVNPFYDEFFERMARTTVGQFVASRKPLNTLVRMNDLVPSPRSSSDSTQTNLSTLFDTQLSRQSVIDQPWEEMIISGPISISLLGQVLVISSKRDFSLEENRPEGGFKYIRYPKSFRATLTQISNEGWSAFMEAHSNMNKIQLYMQQIPNHIKTSLKLIATGTPRLLGNLLPLSLRNIAKIGDECVNISKATHDKFADIMGLLGEVVDVTVLAQGLYDQKLSNVSIELNASLVMKNELEKIGEKIDEEYSLIQDSVKEAREAYKNAVDKIPTGWDAVLQGLVQNIGNMLVRGIGGLIDSYSEVIKNGGRSGGRTGLDEGKSVLSFAKQKALSAAISLSDCLGEFSEGVAAVLSENNTENPTLVFKQFGIFFNAFLEMARGKDEINRQVEEFVSRAIKIADMFTEAYKGYPQSKPDESNTNELNKQTDSLKLEVEQVISRQTKESGKDGIASPIIDQLGGGSIGANEKYKAN